jgi:phosphopantetheinyl transferase
VLPTVCKIHNIRINSDWEENRQPSASNEEEEEEEEFHRKGHKQRDMASHIGLYFRIMLFMQRLHNYMFLYLQ